MGSTRKPWREALGLDEPTSIGLVLQGSRYKAGLTQKELAMKLDVSLRCISEMEHGRRPISVEMAHRLAKALKTGYKMFLCSEEFRITIPIHKSLYGFISFEARRTGTSIEEVVANCIREWMGKKLEEDYAEAAKDPDRIAVYKAFECVMADGLNEDNDW